MKLRSSCSSSACMIIGMFLIWCVGVGSVLDIPESQRFPALLVFGDSIADPGNNNNFILTNANYLPYGQDFQGGKATGRFSNGKLPTDFIAKELSIKELIPAYLDETLQSSDLLTGVSFASGGSGYDPETSSKTGGSRTLSRQLDKFKEYKTKLNSLIGVNETSRIISRSLFIISAGSSDISYTYLSYEPLRRGVYINHHLVKLANDFIKQLHGLGARRIGLFSVPPIGSIPSQTRTQLCGIFWASHCREIVNLDSSRFNSKLSSMADLFNNENKDARVHVLDIFNPLMELIQNPQKNGFRVVDRGCCRTEDAVSDRCTRQTLIPPCSDPTKYVYWDSFHPTQAAYELLAKNISSSSTITKFYT